MGESPRRRDCHRSSTAGGEVGEWGREGVRVWRRERVTVWGVGSGKWRRKVVRVGGTGRVRRIEATELAVGNDLRRAGRRGGKVRM